MSKDSFSEGDLIRSHDIQRGSTNQQLLRDCGAVVSVLNSELTCLTEKLWLRAAGALKSIQTDFE